MTDEELLRHAELMEAAFLYGPSVYDTALAKVQQGSARQEDIATVLKGEYEGAWLFGSGLTKSTR